MRLDGTLVKWNDERGFGFIAPAQGGHEVFVHVSSFPNDGQRPRVGESLSFEIEIAGDGRKRAKAVARPRRVSVPPAHARRSARRREGRGMFRRLLPLVVLVGLGVLGYNEYSQRAGKRMLPPATEPSRAARGVFGEDGAASAFRCDGRIHCSQMTSCAEATYFLRNCPGVKMDGDRDGIPCEEQWCTSALSR